MTSAMVSFQTDHGIFNYRVGGVVIDDGHLLHCRDCGSSVWFLPGGRVEMTESSIESIRRELREELETDCRVLRLLWVIENFFWLKGARFHEIGLYYLVELPTSSPLLDKGAPRIFNEPLGNDMEMRWFPLSALHSIDLRPANLRDRLTDLPDAPVQVVVRDDEIVNLL